MRKQIFLGLGALVTAFSTNVSAEEHVIKAAVTAFRPLVVNAQPGDTIVWQNMAGHDTTTMKGMLPEGAEAWHSKMGEIFSITVEKEGIYLYKCTPHASMGMMGAIVVGGNTDNLESIKSGVDASGEPKGMVKRVIRKVEKELAK
jgi:pseudoazurin